MHSSANLCRSLRALALVTPLAGLAACNSSGTGALEGVGSPAPAAPGATAAAPAVDEFQDPRAYCPKIVLRAGTETYDVYPEKMKRDDPDRAAKMRFRATITQVVRECNYAGTELRIKVGVAGRLLSGPAGESGTFAMPIRVAVTQGDQLLYSQLHDVTAEIPPGRTNGTFTFVDPAIAIPRPQSENIIIYAGYDEQRIDMPNARPADDAQLRPIN